MSSGTDGAVSRDRAAVWAGRVLVIQGVLQLMLTGWLSRMHTGGWSAALGMTEVARHGDNNITMTMRPARVGR